MEVRDLIKRMSNGLLSRVIERQSWEEVNDNAILKGKNLREVGFGFERNFSDKAW